MPKVAYSDAFQDETSCDDMQPNDVNGSANEPCCMDGRLPEEYRNQRDEINDEVRVDKEEANAPSTAHSGQHPKEFYHFYQGMAVNILILP